MFYCYVSVPFGTREAGCFREVAALHSGYLRQVPLYKVFLMVWPML